MGEWESQCVSLHNGKAPLSFFTVSRARSTSMLSYDSLTHRQQLGSTSLLYTVCCHASFLGLPYCSGSEESLQINCTGSRNLGGVKRSESTHPLILQMKKQKPGEVKGLFFIARVLIFPGNQLISQSYKVGLLLN